MFNPGDRVTVLLNTQCHGTVLNSTETETDVKLDNGMTMRFKTEELRLQMFWAGTNVSIDEPCPLEVVFGRILCKD
jgi:hypothetical protein